MKKMKKERKQMKKRESLKVWQLAIGQGYAK